MPRKARIDAPGALHHIFVRGIERRKIFLDDFDRDNFLKRLDNVLSETATPCFAWALIPNHAYLLPRTGTTAIATVMRRLLTGYAVSFNCRHRRHGQLFQNRYKTILCQEAFERLIKRVAKLFDISTKELLSGGRHTKTVEAQSVVCYWGNRELGMSTIELSKKLNISQPTASQSVVRGQKIAHTEKLAFLESHNLYSNGRQNFK